ncbi:unnamed protein product [Rotaria sp. Silwood2]|nr:unnamed protein product [Rotaria sp. Silwood2]CAF3233804.1 unnamed protein product [Rotaria sp. Silwood2]CAF4345812.1 unnamed protein product [Rotaria sp. Silwood2]
MAKKSKDTTASTAKKEAKAKAPVDPIATRNLLRLLNILALLLAITAFILQLFAVITHHWKWQTTDLHPLFASKDRVNQANIDSDSRLEQRYGLYSRDVKVYANNDEQLDILASTRFPRLDNGDDDLHICLSQTSTLRGSLLACSDRIASAEQCHCRRYPHWNAIIFFEITALVLLGLVVLVCALLSTQFRELLKLIGVALSFLAFLFLLLGLIILLSYLKRETRSIADTYPHTYLRLASPITRGYQAQTHKIVRRQAHETYRAYSLSSGQRPYNETHFYQYLADTGKWVPRPYTDLNNAAYEPRAYPVHTQRATTPAPALYNRYGPPLGYDEVYENTHACIGWSTALSIIAMILALLVALILVFSWLTAKKLAPEVKTVTTTTVRTEYTSVPQEVSIETIPLTKQIITEDIRHGPYDNYGGRQEPVVIQDVVIRGEQPIATQTYRT